MSVEWIPFEQHRLIWGKVIPLTDIENLLGSFRLGDVLLRLSQINLLIAKSRIDDQIGQVQEILIRNFFDEGTIKEINDRYAGKIQHAPIFFTRIQMLVLMRTCARVCSDSPEKRKIQSVEEKLDFGRCCLWITDHLESEDDLRVVATSNADEARWNLAPQLGITYELNRPIDLMREIVRTELLFSEIINSPKVREKAAKFDMSETFKTTTGLSIQDFYELTLLPYALLEGQQIQALIDNPSLPIINRHTFLNLTSVSKDSFNCWLQLTATKIGDIEQYFGVVNSRNPIHKDIPLFRDRPIVEFENGRLACLDFEFLVEKLSTGIYWTIVNNFPPKERADAQAVWGSIFEEYINLKFRSVYQLSSKRVLGNFFSDIKYKGEEKEPFDGMLLSPLDPRHLFVFEYKSSFLKPEIKYGDNFSYLEEEIDKKFGRKQKLNGTQKAACNQLISGIKNVWPANKSERKEIVSRLQELISDIPRKIERITPILIVQETFFLSVGFNWKLNEWFQGLRASNDIEPALKIDPLVMIHISDLEKLLPYMKDDIGFFDKVVNSYDYHDPKREQSFNLYLFHYLPQFSSLRDEESLSRYERFMNHLQRIFLEPQNDQDNTTT